MLFGDVPEEHLSGSVLEHGPPTPKFETKFSGPFRLSYRAGAER
jgi:hypothetical protein